MLRSTALTWRLTVGLLMLSACCMLQAQIPGGQQGQNQAPPNSQDKAVKLAGQPANTDDSGKPLDEQKSAPVQVLTRVYDLNKLTHEPKVPETVFRGRVLWVQKCAFCHDGLGQPTYKTMVGSGPGEISDRRRGQGTHPVRHGAHARLPVRPEPVAGGRSAEFPQDRARERQTDAGASCRQK